MASSALRRCQNCDCETDITNVLGVFEDNPHCRQCGLSVSEGDAKTQDELANLMTHKFHLNSPMPSQQQTNSISATPQVVPHVLPITYISQHYHHSAHQVPTTARLDDLASSILSKAGVNASALLPSQLQLFRDAPHDQQIRLIELWTIAPPKNGYQRQAEHLHDWPETSLQHEEEAAKQEWERLDQERYKSFGGPQEARISAEPYMAHGYNGAVDPVHQSREWWRMPASQPMEHQYGILQHMQMYGQPLDQSGDDMEML